MIDPENDEAMDFVPVSDAVLSACEWIAEESVQLAPEGVREELRGIRRQLAVVEGYPLSIPAFDRFQEALRNVGAEHRTAALAALNALVGSCLVAVTHWDDYPLLIARAADSLGQLRALVTPPEDLVERLRLEAQRQAGAEGGRARAKLYAVHAETVRMMYGKWKTGELKFPTVRKGRRVADFDAWAADKLGLNPDTVKRYRRNNQQ